MFEEELSFSFEMDEVNDEGVRDLVAAAVVRAIEVFLQNITLQYYLHEAVPSVGNRNPYLN